MRAGGLERTEASAAFFPETIVSSRDTDPVAVTRRDLLRSAAASSAAALPVSAASTGASAPVRASDSAGNSRATVALRINVWSVPMWAGPSGPRATARRGRLWSHWRRVVSTARFAASSVAVKASRHSRIELLRDTGFSSAPILMDALPLFGTTPGNSHRVWITTQSQAQRRLRGCMRTERSQARCDCGRRIARRPPICAHLLSFHICSRSKARWTSWLSN
jgi:hypothetical protein